MAEFRQAKENLIETEYLGDARDFCDTRGEAFYDVKINKWKFRPFGDEMFHIVDPDELDCANDSGYLKGEYVGAKSIKREGKASWDEERELWGYIPKGTKRVFYIPEEDFKIRRDEDVVDVDEDLLD